MIDLHCNICNQKISVGSQHLGQAVRCPKCGNVLKAIEPLSSKEETPDATHTSRSLNAVIIAALILTFSFTGYMAVKQFRPIKTDGNADAVTHNDQKAQPAVVKSSSLAKPTTNPAIGRFTPNKPSPELARPQINEPLEPIPPKPITPSPINPAPPAPPRPVTPPPIDKVKPAV